MASLFSLIGRSVRLAPMGIEHAAEIAKTASKVDDSYDYVPLPRTEGMAAKYILLAIRDRGAGRSIPFVVIRNSDNELIGATRFLNLQYWHAQKEKDGDFDVPSAVEIGGSWLTKEARGTGINTECKLLMLEQAFDVWGVARVSLRVDQDNSRSCAAISKLGIQCDGVRRAHKQARDGRIRGTAYFSVLVEEWPQVRKHILEVQAQEDLIVSGISPYNSLRGRS
ncbi:GNAT family N-acetyltransferase [Streptomyces erythrochromogenes]|uniref:GNAT family N-acetyltransferase n=1 Tax=Streptomyces erythrochromogenes TaxID=285574 RepID=UPI00369D82F5